MAFVSGPPLSDGLGQLGDEFGVVFGSVGLFPGIARQVKELRYTNLEQKIQQKQILQALCL